jgi:hypothetical protein
MKIRKGLYGMDGIKRQVCVFVRSVKEKKMEVKTKTATLFLIKSVNSPVFRQGSEIYYTNEPKVGESFLFSQRGLHYCNFSEVKKSTKFDGFKVIQTRNSYYVIREELEKESSDAV